MCWFKNELIGGLIYNGKIEKWIDWDIYVYNTCLYLSIYKATYTNLFFVIMSWVIINNY